MSRSKERMGGQTDGRTRTDEQGQIDGRTNELTNTEERMDGRTNEWTNRRTNGREEQTDRQTDGTKRTEGWTNERTDVRNFVNKAVSCLNVSIKRTNGREE